VRTFLWSIPGWLIVSAALAAAVCWCGREFTAFHDEITKQQPRTHLSILVDVCTARAQAVVVV
jgi:hypothetical protein